MMILFEIPPWRQVDTRSVFFEKMKNFCDENKKKKNKKMKINII